MSAYNAIQLGATSYPYHSDGELCTIFSAEDIIKISEAAIAFKLYHVTYCNHLNIWINRSGSVSEVENIFYGIALPEDLQSNFEQIMNSSIGNII